MGVYDDLIDLAYYRDTYKGEAVADDDELGKLISRASDDINAKTGWAIDDITGYATVIASLIKQATAAQVEWYVLNGETYNDSEMDDVTISKFSYSGKSKTAGALLCKRAGMYLSQTGLTFRGVGVFDPDTGYIWG